MSALDLRVRVDGARHGAAVLLLHGLGDSLDPFWDSGWAAALAGRRLVAFDARGHGGSPRPTSADAYADSVRVADALAVLDHAGLRRAHLVGYSMGAWTAMRLAAEAPHRVASLVVGGAHPFGQSLEPLRRLVSGGVEAFVDAIARTRRLPAAARERFLGNDAAALAAVIAEDRPALDLTTLRAPLFSWAGEHDPLASHIERFAAQHGGAFVRVPHAGHFAAFDDPALLRVASSWIAERSWSASSNMKTWSEPGAST
jgi:pimeloyl-ACP methyl ester carboxylesterase